MTNRRKPSPVLTEIMSKITDEDREKTRKEMMKEIENCDNSRDRNVSHCYISMRYETKITEDIIQEFFINKLNWFDDTLTWADENGYETTTHYYTSPCRRYILTYDYESNICDERGDGWNLHIDNSDMNSIGNVSVNYVEEVVQILDIFEKY